MKQCTHNVVLVQLEMVLLLYNANTFSSDTESEAHILIYAPII